MDLNDETAVSEISILPDGRVFVLGASRQVLEILEVLSPADKPLKQRLERAGETGGSALANTGGGMKISVRPAKPFRENCES